MLDDFLKQRYGSWDSGLGADIEAGPNESGRVEMLKNMLNEYI